jgi:putative tricarboxylic transport membrane protein
LMAVGALGIFLRRFEFSRPAFLIGFVLSAQAETFTNMANQIASSRFRRSFEEGMEYVASPIVLIILALTVASVIIGIRQGKQVLGRDDPPTGTKRAPLVFMLGVTFYVAFAWVNALQISYFGDKVFPVAVGTVTLIGCLVLLIRMMRATEADAIFADMEQGDEDGKAPHGLWTTLAWFGFLLLLSSLLGFILALAIFLVTFLRMRAKATWTRTLILAAFGIGFMCFLGGVLGRDFPPGLLQDYMDLPWPLT